MVSNEISKDELKQLLVFMQRVKSFERTFMIQKDSIIRLIWGLLLMGAGILDWVMIELQFITDAVGFFALFPWIIAMLSGLIIQMFSNRHITNIYSREIKKKSNILETLILMCGFFLIATVVFIFNVNGIHFLTFPTISIISGMMILVLDRKTFQEHKDILNRYSYYLMPILSISASILMILLYLLENGNFRFHGMIFGIIFGGSFVITAFWNRKNIQNFIEKTEMD